MGVLQLTKPLLEPPVLPNLARIRVRTFAEVTDIEPWLELRHRAFARETLGVRQWTARDFEREFLARAWWRPERMWLAEPESPAPGEPSVLGSVTLALRGDGPAAKPVVHWLAVLPRHRRQGLGRLLMARLERAAWDAGYRQLWLETHDGWQAAAALYAALGYETAR